MNFGPMIALTVLVLPLTVSPETCPVPEVPEAPREWQVSRLLIAADLTTRAALTRQESLTVKAIADILSPSMGDQGGLPDDLKQAVQERAVACVDRVIWPSSATRFLHVVRAGRDPANVSWRSRFVTAGVYTGIRGTEQADRLTGLQILVAHVRGQTPPARFNEVERRLGELARVPPLPVEFGESDDSGNRVFYKGWIYTLAGEPPKQAPPASAPSTQPSNPQT